MTEIVDESADIDLNDPEVTFDILVILKEFGNIVNLVGNEDFLETVPKAKLRRVKWVPMFNCLKQGIIDEMVQEFTSMWEYEDMHKKLQQLDKQKEKFADCNEDLTLWRPKLGDVKSQLRGSDVDNLKKQKVLLESLAKEYETRVNKLKKIISAKRGYLKAMQMDIQKYQKKNEDVIPKLEVDLDNHTNLARSITQDEKVDFEASLSDKDME